MGEESVESIVDRVYGLAVADASLEYVIEDLIHNRVSADVLTAVYQSCIDRVDAAGSWSLAAAFVYSAMQTGLFRSVT